jgi:hypothetical protein
MRSGQGPTSNQTFLPRPSGSTPQDVATASTMNKPQLLVEPESGLTGRGSNGGPASMTSTRTRSCSTSRTMICSDWLTVACMTALVTSSVVSSSMSDTTSYGSPDAMAETAARAKAGVVSSGGNRSSAWGLISGDLAFVATDVSTRTMVHQPGTSRFSRFSTRGRQV